MSNIFTGIGQDGFDPSNPGHNHDERYYTKLEFDARLTYDEFGNINGIAGPGALFEYSIDGATLWHSTFVSGDIYTRVSVDGGTAWSDAIKFIGDQGIQGEQGIQGPAGTNGTNGIDGEDGVGIASITLISTVGKVKTYRITYTNSSTFDYDVIDGADGTGTGDLLSTNNLSDLANIETARDNLDVYSTTEVDTALDLKQNLALTNLASTNLNTIVTNGKYCAAATCSNLPETSVKTRLIVNVDPTNSDLAMQEALTTTTQVSYVRTTANGGSTWTAWARIKATDETKVNLTGGNSISGNQNFDSGTLYVDATNNRIGIGTTTPDRELEIKSTTNARIRLSADSDNTGADDEASLLMSVDGGIDYMKIEFKNIEGTASDLKIYGPTSANALIIDGDNGNIALSTTDTTYKLNVSGDINYTGTLKKSGTDILATKADKTNVLELNNTTPFTPDADYEPATKKYVDDNAGGGGITPIRITIPGEQIADTANYQGLYFYNDTGATITISNVAFALGKAAAGVGAACAYNLYKSSGTASDGLNTSAVPLFSSAVDLTTNYTSLTNTPNTTTVENGRWITLRCTSSAGATNKGSDLQCIITYS